MPYNKGDFTQQGINGDVSALVRLNEKRVVKVVLSSDDESDNCDISGAVYDLLNGTSYSLGGSEPTGTNGIELIKTVNLGALQTTSTTAVTTGQPDITINEADDNLSKYDLILLAAISDATAAGYHKATFTELVLSRTTDISAKDSVTFVSTRAQHIIGSDTSKTIVKAANTNNGITTTSTSIALSAGTLTIPTLMGYSSSGTGTIDANYQMYVFGITFSELPYTQV